MVSYAITEIGYYTSNQSQILPTKYIDYYFSFVALIFIFIDTIVKKEERGNIFYLSATNLTRIIAHHYSFEYISFVALIFVCRHHSKEKGKRKEERGNTFFYLSATTL